jgi:hypothetical protein
MQGAKTYAVVVLVDGADAADGADVVFGKHGCVRGKRYAMFADAREKDDLGPGDEMLAIKGQEKLFDAVSREMMKAFVAEVARAGVGTRADTGDLQELLVDVGVEVHHSSWQQKGRDDKYANETAMQDEVRNRVAKMVRKKADSYNLAAELVDCLVRAAPAVRAGEKGAPVFAVEACADGGGQCWAVTSYFPEAMRHTIFQGVPVCMRSKGGLV